MFQVNIFTLTKCLKDALKKANSEAPWESEKYRNELKDFCDTMAQVIIQFNQPEKPSVKPRKNIGDDLVDASV